MEYSLKTFPPTPEFENYLVCWWKAWDICHLTTTRKSGYGMVERMTWEHFCTKLSTLVLKAHQLWAELRLRLSFCNSLLLPLPAETWRCCLELYNVVLASLRFRYIQPVLRQHTAFFKVVLLPGPNQLKICAIGKLNRSALFLTHHFLQQKREKTQGGKNWIGLPLITCGRCLWLLTLYF